MAENTRKCKSYYFTPVKFVRDLVHGYVYLTKFDLDIIDTLQFQRLSDIRQLTCQHVFPSAHHTRFEHSIGVMELTRQAIKSLNKNGFISNINNKNHFIINENLQFNAAIAALLHDVGHCPFSHLGENEFDKKLVWNKLYESAKCCQELKGSSIIKDFFNLNKTHGEKPGSVHEQMSCIIILEKFEGLLAEVKRQHIYLDKEQHFILYVDFELIIRSILGMEYDVSTSEEFKNNKEKNIIVNLIHSNAFDMDKLDYIMRDSLFTGIGAPSIDTKRLFKNMLLNNENEYKLIFTNRAIPPLQNMIEARDELYMYVYNHHTVVFSDFINSYIFRRLAHNERDFLSLAILIAEDENERKKKIGSPIINESLLNAMMEESYEDITKIGAVNKSYLFSHNAVIEQNRSDADVVSLLNVIHFSLERYYVKGKYAQKKISRNKSDSAIFPVIIGEIDKQLEYYGILANTSKILKNKHDSKKIDDQLNKVLKNTKRVYRLIDNYLKHRYLKPWWKTISEFTNFINTNFQDDNIRKRLCDWICEGKERELNHDEFCSQLAKNVTYITQKMVKDMPNKYAHFGLLQCLENDEFFVIPRSARFFDPKTISELDIALKSNELLGSPRNVKYRTGDYYIKKLTNVIPQRDYYSMYAKNSFYIFSKALSKGKYSSESLSRHYRFIEQIFVFVATTLINNGVRNFQSNYGKGDLKDSKIEEDAHENMYDLFKSNCLHFYEKGAYNENS